MRLTVRLFGLDLLDVDLSTDSSSPEPEDDTARDLSGGTLGHYPAEHTPTDLTMGFTGGWEVRHDDD